MTSQQFLVYDSSTLANFKQWAQAISNFFAAAGWIKASDTGQVDWSTIAAVPGSNVYVYEVWKPGDALTPFFLKVEYGNMGANAPNVRLTISNTTNGAGTPTGTSISQPCSTFGQPLPALVGYECNFSGDSSRMGAMLWRDSPNFNQQFFAIERSINASGAYTGTYVTLYVCASVSNAGTFGAWQQTFVFAAGSVPVASNDGPRTASSGFFALVHNTVNASTSAFNNSIPFDTAAPALGYFDYPGTVVGVARAADFAEGVTFGVSLYGAARTYMPSKNGPFANTGMNTASGALCMRFD